MLRPSEWTAQRKLAQKLSVKKPKTDALAGQLLDGQLLALSPLYRKSRQLFLKLGGEFRAELLSSPRSLGSANLTSLTIAYTPSEAELLWSMRDPIESRRPDHFVRIRELSTSIFHEQNHRVLWKEILPPPPTRGRDSLLLYFNLAEALVVMLDQALGDELGPETAGFFYRAGTLYDPGTTMRRDSKTALAWRNSLHAGMYSTYLALGGMAHDEAHDLVKTLYPEAGRLGDRAIVRSQRLDRQFIERTNPIWQGRHGKQASQAIRRLQDPQASKRTVALSSDPGDHRLPWLIAERTLRKFGI